ncbi:MAG: aldehyde ferredoxin oxidoreductase N-terminal domain-containing protein [Candidatus Freyarchaeota archaeon]
MKPLIRGDQEWKAEPLDMSVAKKFIGGFGWNNWLAYNLIEPDADPLSPENPIIVGAGPLDGTMAPLNEQGLHEKMTSSLKNGSNLWKAKEKRTR